MLERGQTSLRKYLRALGQMPHIVKNKRKHGPALGAASIMHKLLLRPQTEMEMELFLDVLVVLVVVA